MGSSRTARIFVEQRGQLFDFVWADVCSDGSIVTGLAFDSRENVEFVADGANGLVKRPQLDTKPRTGRSKVSFHATGHYKLETMMKNEQSGWDRATVVGPRIADIDQPRRMLEIILPRTLPIAARSVGSRDVILRPDLPLDRPLRCTISCMSKETAENLLPSAPMFVDTSDWEYSQILADETHVWIWTLRVSENDEGLSTDRTHIVLFGVAKWGAAQQDVAALVRSSREKNRKRSRDGGHTNPTA